MGLSWECQNFCDNRAQVRAVVALAMASKPSVDVCGYWGVDKLRNRNQVLKFRSTSESMRKRFWRRAIFERERSDWPATSAPQEIQKSSVGSKIVEACIVWLFEALVGLIPLGAHYFIHIVATIAERPALCLPDLHGCHLVSDAPYAEICILAVVIAGISVIGSLGFGHHFRRSELTRLTYALIALRT